MNDLPKQNLKELLVPSVLTQEPLPKPVHGLNPRTIKGKKWWDEKRRVAYSKLDYHCHACGRHKSSDEFKPNVLEAHETYEIDHASGRVEVGGIVALCNTCHNFIHMGRIGALLQKDQISERKVKGIIKHGNRVCRGNDLIPFYFGIELWMIICGIHAPQMESILARQGLQQWWESYRFQKLESYTRATADWSDWRLILDGEEHPPVHESEQAWAKYYASK